jgi:MacB-like periplasmic core domain
MLGQDLRYALRGLRQNPVFSVLAVLTLALAIGASGAIFSVVNAVVLRPLPYRNAEGLAVLWKIIPSKNHEWDCTSLPVFETWRRQNHSFEDLALISRLHFFTVMAGDGPEQFEAVLVSANFFSMLGVAPELGRYYTDEDQRQGAQVMSQQPAIYRHAKPPALIRSRPCGTSKSAGLQPDVRTRLPVSRRFS